jgi:hypothetical protein
MRRLLIICCLGALIAGCKGGADKDDKAPPAPKENADFRVEHNAAGEAVVFLSPEAQKRIELQVSAVQPANFQPELTAYGTVLDPAPLLAIQGEIEADQAALEPARKAAEREKELFAEGGNVSQKTVETAESEQHAADIKLKTAQRNLEFDWGTAIASLNAAGQQELADKIAAHQTSLVRADLPMGDSIAEMPSSAVISVAGMKSEYAAASISPALKADPKTLGQGFILRVDGNNPALAPGAAVTARLKISGPSTTGVAIPDSAVVRFEGKTWVYIAGPDNKFTRRVIAADTPLDQGWFSTNGPPAGEHIVVQATALLLSEEQKAEIQTD